MIQIGDAYDDMSIVSFIVESTFDLSTSTSDSSTGTSDSSTGTSDSSTGTSDSSSSTSDSSSSTSDSSTGTSDSSTGTSDSSTGTSDSSTGTSDSSTGASDSSTGTSDSSTGTSDSSSSTSDSSTSTSGSTSSDSLNYQLILVKEQKTWEEALQYCRMNYTALAYNIFDTQLLLPETAAAETISVWIGLRLVDGEWMWVNGVQVKSLVSLPLCAVPYRRCVAYDINMHTYENRDCSEKLNFLCFKR
ncbi:secretory phospholipase A2 receptor-like [Tachysurus ichikawai]